MPVKKVVTKKAKPKSERESGLKNYIVYYKTNSTFEVDKNLKREDVGFEKGFVKIGTFKADKLETIFEMFQRENLASNGLSIKPRIGHKSITTGDCVYCIDEDRLYQFNDFGWLWI